MKKIRMIEVSVALGLVFTLLFSVVSFGLSCNNIRDEVVRLHILANSDSDIDQHVKLVVRDKLLQSGNELFSGDMTAETAFSRLSDNKETIEAYINNILSEEGFDYCAEVCLVKEYYPTRAYESFTMPAGEYLSLKIILGNGEGHNWWCVMFPPLCLPAASQNTDINAVFDDNCVKIVKSSDKYEIRFKIVEIFERLRSRKSYN
ncbi:MAG: stage II sporulation protein R [Ruminococcaceae bacterium]|nr:stage II sporulation protein R [Oscillospiraceae bacterium]